MRHGPLQSYAPNPDAAAPVLGMVHGDLDAADSSYGPLDRVRLQAMPVNARLLGHIHTPRLIEQSGCRRVLYPGSPQALDPGEPGVHGPWSEAQGAANLHFLLCSRGDIRYLPRVIATPHPPAERSRSAG